MAAHAKPPPPVVVVMVLAGTLSVALFALAVVGVFLGSWAFILVAGLALFLGLSIQGLWRGSRIFAIGMGAAARFLAGLDWQAATRHELALTERLLDGLSQIPDVRVIGPSGLQGRIGVVSFEAEGAHSHDICHLLGARGICLRGGHHCAQPVMDFFGIPATARASLAMYNTREEIDVLAASVERAQGMFA